MPAINFSAKFAKLVEDGDKWQTIRKRRKKRPIRQGDTLYLYTGMRTKCCRMLREALCISVEPISIEVDLETHVDGRRLTWPEKKILAVNDGFHNFFEMADFFRSLYGLPFKGVLIKWW